MTVARRAVRLYAVRGGIGLAILVVVACLGLLIVVATGVVALYTVPSTSMEPLIMPGNWIVVDRAGFHAANLRRGDVIVFDNPAYVAGQGAGANPLAQRLAQLVPPADRVLVKRVIAVGGQTVQVTADGVEVDGRTIREPYVRPGGEGKLFGPYRVPAGSYFVLGDNRVPSVDSRELLGHAIPASSVIGRVVAVVHLPFGIHLLGG